MNNRRAGKKTGKSPEEETYWFDGLLEKEDLSEDTARELREHFIRIERWIYGGSADDTLLETFAGEGETFPPPEEVGEKQVKERLSTMIGKLAERSIYVEGADDIRDADLYTVLFNEILLEPRDIPPIGSATMEHVCVDELLPGSSSGGGDTFGDLFVEDGEEWDDEPEKSGEQTGMG